MLMKIRGKIFFVFDATPSRHEFDKRYEIYISNYWTLCIHILIVVIDILITTYIHFLSVVILVPFLKDNV